MVYISHLDKLIEDFKLRFGDIDIMHLPEWLASPFDMKIDNKGYDLEDELIKLYVDLKAKALFKSKTSMNIGAISMPQLCTLSSEQLPNLSYFHTHLHTWLKVVLAM